MDNVLSVAFCHRELGTIQAEGSTRTCTGAFCFFDFGSILRKMKGRDSHEFIGD